MNFESNGIAYELRDISFIRAEKLDVENDCLLLRVSMRKVTEGQAELPLPVDALIRLDIASYLHHQDGRHTTRVINQQIADEDPPHRTYEEYLKWVNGDGGRLQ